MYRVNGKRYVDPMLVFTELLFVIIIGVVSWVVYANSVNDKQYKAQQVVRQEEVSKFYAKHNCKSEGYVAARYEPVRTYRCDNGLFIARDMK